jgi:hypothetical protein
MSRHGYSDDIDQWDLIKWRGQANVGKFMPAPPDFSRGSLGHYSDD